MPPRLHPTRPCAAAASSGRTSPLPPPPPTHVLICGAGIVGTSTAYFLAKAGVPRITLIDSSGPAAAASGRAGGFLARDWCGEGAWGKLAAAGFDLHAELAAELGPETVGYRRVSTFSARFVAGGKAAAGCATANPVPWLSASAHRLASMGGPSTTAQVHPRLLTEALLARAGPVVQLVRDEVTGLREGGGGGGSGAQPSAVLKGAGPVAADAVVVALGPWTGRFLRTCGISGPAAGVGGRRAHSIVVSPVPSTSTPLPGPECIFSRVTQNGGELGAATTEPEVYPRPDGTVYVCGAGDGEALPASAEGACVPDPAAIAALTADAAAVSPALAGGEVTSSACYLPVTPSGLPVVGPLGGGLWVAAGHSCWGILTGPATGRALAAWVVEGEGAGGGLVGAFAP